MAKPIYQTRNGERVKLTATEVKNFIMKEHGWSTEQYQKEYDKLRNRLRNYEKLQRVQGVVVEPQSPANIMYFEAKKQKQMGAEYSPSLELQRIKGFTSASTGKAYTPKDITRLEARYAQTTNKAFARFIEANPTARLIGTEQDIIIDPRTGKRRIATPADDPSSTVRGYLIPSAVKREEALKELAKEVHARQDEAGRIESESAIPFGQAMGSDVAVDFSIESYL